MSEITFTGKPAGMGPKGAWVFLDLSEEVTRAISTKARTPIVVTLDGKEFRASASRTGTADTRSTSTGDAGGLELARW
jgi:hypothetical protein